MNMGHVWRIRAARELDYQSRHAEVWPELEELFRSLGVSQYDIYRWGSIVSSHLKVADYERLKREYDTDPIAARWEEEVGQLLEYPNADPEYGWPEELTNVWSLADRPGT